MTKELRRRTRHRNGPTSASKPDGAKHSKTKSDWVVKIFVTGVLVTVVSLLAFYKYRSFLKGMVITPLNSPKILNAGSTTAEENAARFWGTYRSHTYFGLKTRTPRSPVVGW